MRVHLIRKLIKTLSNERQTKRNAKQIYSLFSSLLCISSLRIYIIKHYHTGDSNFLWIIIIKNITMMRNIVIYFLFVLLVKVYSRQFILGKCFLL